MNLIDQPLRSVTAYPECIGNPVDVIKPGRDQGDLQDRTVVETAPRSRS